MMRPHIHVIGAVLFSLAAISTAIPAKKTTRKSVGYESPSNNWAAMKIIQGAHFVKPASRVHPVSTAKISKAVSFAPVFDTYKDTSEVRAKSSKASISSPQLRAYKGTSRLLKSIDLAHPVYSKISSRYQVSKSFSLPFSDRQSGLTGDRCTTSSDCAGDRICSEDFADDGLRCSFEGGAALICTTTGDCTTGEVCVPNIGVSGASLCVSSSFSAGSGNGGNSGSSGSGSGGGSEGSGGASGSGGQGTTQGSGGTPANPGTGTPDNNGQSEPCIGAHLLQHMSRDELIFEKDRLANVLCDENESCATPGHMVKYHGRGMMMKSYCEAVGGCVKKVMFVNSPRYRMGASVMSKSGDMIFTSFSARYVTRTEEGVLSMAIRLGF